jgi:hypothetical protein
MITTAPQKRIEDLSTAELEAMLAKKRKAEEKLLEKDKQEYEAQRDAFVSEKLQRAMELENMIAQFKQECHVGMEEQSAKLEAYGKLRSNSKGGFSLTDEAGILRITRIRNTEPHWDERSLKGVELIEGFLTTTVKKRDKDLYEILISFLKRSENGHLEYNRVMVLIQHENKFNDVNWLEGIRLIKEGYSNNLKAYGYEFKTRSSTEKWNNINLTFASV